LLLTQSPEKLTADEAKIFFSDSHFSGGCMKRSLTLLMVLIGSMIVQAQPHDPSFQLYITKVELTGEVTLVWNKPSGMGGNIQYELYRAMVPDSSAFALITATGGNFYVDKVPTTITNIANSYAYYVVAKWNSMAVKSNVQLVPIAGVPPVGSFRLVGKIENAKVKLEWQQPPTGTVSYYRVHGGHAAIAAPILPVIDSTTNRWSVTDAPAIFNSDSPVPFHYYVVAKLTSGETLVSTMLQLTFHARQQRDQVKFTSIPPLRAEINKKYEYTAAAISSDPAAVIRYSGWISQGMLTVIVPGFSIDSVSGVVDWTPVSKGFYTVVIVARSDKGGVAQQNFSVAVAGGNGIIQGKITDTLNAPIPNAVVEVFKTENNIGMSFAYAAKTDANGNYRIGRVDPGSYKLKANAPSMRYQSQWYDGKRDAMSADVIAVQDSPAVTIANFKLRGGISTLPKITVTGTVKDTLGLAINGRNSRVAFVRAEFALNFGAGATIGSENFRKYFEFNARGDYRLEGNSDFVFKSAVDSLGNYSVQLPPGGYIAFARAAGYAAEFYNEKPDLLSADVILLQENTIDIHFTLSPLPPIVLGEIKGAVIDSALDIPVPARVIAFRDRWRVGDKHGIARVYVTDTDSMGAYAFSDLLPGRYVVLAVPLGSYAPAFYSENDTANFRWKRASVIVIDGNSIDDINIFVRPLDPSLNGFTNIFGKVEHGGNSGTAKAGTIVYAYRNNRIAGYAFTNANGNYSINGLAPGQYTVFADKPGFNESSVVTVGVAYDLTGSPLSGSADFTLTSLTSVTVDRTVQPTEYVLEQNYPNPFNPATSIRYTLPAAGDVTMKVFDVLGKEVAILVNQFQQSGNYTVTFTANDLSSGIYFYRLETGSVKQVKKMILIK
jgi:protocatechuate 3,4-dioxygenase beta subunit